MTSKEIRDNRQDSATIATAVATAVVRFEAMEVAVEVTTCCMPPMSLVIRDWTSPLRVRVKNPSDWRCRCSNTVVRSRCMTRCPMVVLIQVCTTPSTAVSAAMATMPATSHPSTRTSCRGSATSMTARSRKGWAIATTDDATMIAVTIVSASRCSEKSPAIRRSETELA